MHCVRGQGDSLNISPNVFTLKIGLRLFYNVFVPSNATHGVCNTQIDLFIYYHYMFRPLFQSSSGEPLFIRCSFELQANLPIWAHIYNIL
jgi:hypothetical protein